MRTSTNLLRLLCAVLLVTLVTSLPAAGGQAARADGPDPADGKLLLLLDSSGSMAEGDASGQSKIQAARASLRKVVDRLATGAQVGMRVYGQSDLSKGDPGACTDTELVVPVGADNRAELKRAIGRYQPAGETPIAYSLRKAAVDLGGEGQRTILLVSDGEETCHPDPCDVAREIAAQGIELKIDVVGFRVGAAARQQLQCIAREGRGDYYDADSEDDLLASLDRLATRAFRPFRVSGTPVEGTPDEVGAPEIGPGRYATRVGTEGDTRFYKLRKAAGSTAWISVAARPFARSGADTININVATDDGESCSALGGWAGEYHNQDLFPVITGGVRIGPQVAGAPTATPDSAECANAEELYVSLSRSQQSAPEILDVELLVIEEPPLADDGAGLPPAARELPSQAGGEDARTYFKPRGDVRPVAGGASFADAPTLTPGTYSDGILPGEALVYRVRADFGQRLVVAGKILKPTPALARTVLNGMYLEADVYGPTRIDTRNLHNLNRAYVTGDPLPTASYFLAFTPEIQYLNRYQEDNSGLPAAALAGYYYIVVAARGDDANRYVLPYHLDIKLVGEPSGQPLYDEPVANPIDEPSEATAPPTDSSAAEHPDNADTRSDSDDAGKEEGGAPLGLVAAAAGATLGALVLVGLALLLLARRR